MSLALHRYIRVTYSFPGLHYWPDAPEEMYWLRLVHRHMFIVKMTLPVSHADRHLEFFTMQKQLKEYCDLSFAYGEFATPLSCEQMAEMILRKFNAVEVEVSEDGENAGIVRWEEVGEQRLCEVPISTT